MPFKRSRAVPLLLGIIVLTQLSALAPNSIALANSPRSKNSAKPATDWSKAMVESTMKRFPQPRISGHGAMRNRCISTANT